MKSMRILTGGVLLLIAATAAASFGALACCLSASGLQAVAPASAVQHGKGEGKITAIDEAKGLVTLDHGEITALKWPPMSMGFEASADLLKGLKVGDRVAFELDWNGATGRITRIEALPAS